MKRLILLVSIVSCMAFAQAQTVELATIGVFDASTGTLRGIVDTLDLSNYTIPTNQRAAIESVFGTGYAGALVLMVTNNSSSPIAAGDSLRIENKINGVSFSSITLTMKEALDVDSSTVVITNGYIYGAPSKGGLNTCHYSVVKHNNDPVTDAGDAWYYLLAAGQSIVENVFANTNVYPNPTASMLNISNVENTDINIYAINGQLVKSEKNANGNVSIDLSDMASGMYIVRMQNGNSVRTEKIQVVK